MDKHHIVGTELMLELTNRLNQILVLHIPDRPSYLDQRNISRILLESVFYFLFDQRRHMRDDLHIASMIFTIFLSFKNLLVDLPRRPTRMPI